MECCQCGEIKKLKYRCAFCNEGFCAKCFSEEYYAYKEWLTVSTRCGKCERVVCGDCIQICYTCYNIAEDNNTYCPECKELVADVCSIHDWPVCKMHKDESCGKCQANKNDM